MRHYSDWLPMDCNRNISIGNVKGDVNIAKTVVVKKGSNGYERQNRQELYNEEQSPVTDSSTYGDQENVPDEDQQLPPAGIATYEDQMNANSSVQAHLPTMSEELPAPVPVTGEDSSSMRYALAGQSMSSEDQNELLSQDRMESDGFVDLQMRDHSRRNNAVTDDMVASPIAMSDLKHHTFDCEQPNSHQNQEEEVSSEQNSTNAFEDSSSGCSSQLENSQLVVKTGSPDSPGNGNRCPSVVAESHNPEQKNDSRCVQTDGLEECGHITENKGDFPDNRFLSREDSWSSQSVSIGSHSSLSSQSKSILVVESGPLLLQDDVNPEVSYAVLKTNDECLKKTQHTNSFPNGPCDLLKVHWKGMRALLQTWWCLKLETEVKLPICIQNLFRHVCTLLQERQAHTIRAIIKCLLDKLIYLQKVDWEDGLVFFLGHINPSQRDACLQEEEVASIKEILLQLIPADMAVHLIVKAKVLDENEADIGMENPHSSPEVFEHSVSGQILYHSHSQPSLGVGMSDSSVAQKLINSLLWEEKLQKTTAQILKEQEFQKRTIQSQRETIACLQQQVSQLKNQLQSVDESVQSRQLNSEEALKKELMGYLEKTAEEHNRDFSELLKKSTKGHTEMLQWQHEFEGREQKALESAVNQVQEMCLQHQEMVAESEKSIKNQLFQLQTELLNQITTKDKNLETFKQEMLKKGESQVKSEERRHQGLLMQLFQMQSQFEKRVRAVEEALSGHTSLAQETDDVVLGAEGGTASYAGALSETEKTTKWRAKEEISFNQYVHLRLEASQLESSTQNSRTRLLESHSASLPADSAAFQTEEMQQLEETAPKTPVDVAITQGSQNTKSLFETSVDSTTDDNDAKESDMSRSPTEREPEETDMSRAEQFLDWLSISGSLRYREEPIKILMQSVHEALKEEKQPPPRAKSLDTILCLDVSASVVENPGLAKVKQIALKFVDGVEDLMEEMDLEENIAVVTMGKKAKVIQHLTNDLSLVRDAIGSVDNEAGGRSPFMQALLVCLAANKGRGGVVNVAGVYKVHPRIIFITDGHPTDESVESGSDSPTNLSQVKFSLVQLITEISSKKHKSTPRPIFWVPVGTKANMAFLDSLAELCGGRSVPAEDIKSLCRYFKIHQTAGRVYKMLKNHPDRYVDQQMQSVVTAISPNLTINEQRTVLEIVMKLKDKPPEEEEPEADSFDHLFEDKEKVKTCELLPLGTRVVRGPDWKWKNQDTDGAGTVIQHGKEDNWIYVKWDNGTLNAYRYNENGKVDIKESKHHPRELPLDCPSLDFGVRVVRGPDWKFENQDGEGPGIVVRWRKSDGKCKVRWDNMGTFHEYYYSAKRGHEVQIDTPQFARDGAILQTGDGKPTEKSVSQTSTKTIPMWKWRDENRRWRLYSKDISVKLENEYQKRQQGSAVIMKNGMSWRVSFKTWQERAVDKSVAHDVERELVDEEGKNDLLAFEISLQID